MNGNYIPRRIAVAAVMLLLCGLTGWASRRWPMLLPMPIRKRTGDALWASCIFESVVIFRPKWPAWQCAAVALGIAYSIEFGQLYHSSPGLEHLRTTLPGRLILGSGFSWLDQLAYTIGVVAVAGADQLLGSKVPRAPVIAR